MGDQTPLPVQSPDPVTPLAGGGGAKPPKPPTRKVASGGKPKRQPTGDYDVGNCKPPEHGKIKKGEVRNPRGRPQGARGLNTVVRAVMEEKITLRLPRGEKKMSRVEALILKTVENGFGGNSRAALGALMMYAKAAPEAPTENPKVVAATAESDDALIEAFKAILMIGEAATEADDEDAVSERADDTSDEEGSDHE